MSEISSYAARDRDSRIQSATQEASSEDGFGMRSPEKKEAGSLAEPPSEQLVSDQRPNYSAFSDWEKRGIVLGAAIGAFFSPLTAQIYLPALVTLADEFNVTISQINLTVTTYMVC